MLTFGPEARLVRAVLEPTCPVPLVAWPRLGLPGWVGPLDVVVITGGSDRVSLAAAYEAVRRGCRLLVACPSGVGARPAIRLVIDDPAAHLDR